MNEDVKLCFKFKESKNQHCEVKLTVKYQEACRVMTEMTIGGGVESISLSVNGQQKEYTKEKIIDIWLED